MKTVEELTAVLTNPTADPMEKEKAASLLTKFQIEYGKWFALCETDEYFQHADNTGQREIVAHMAASLAIGSTNAEVDDVPKIDVPKVDGVPV